MDGWVHGGPFEAGLLPVPLPLPLPLPLAALL